MAVNKGDGGCAQGGRFISDTALKVGRSYMRDMMQKCRMSSYWLHRLRTRVSVQYQSGLYEVYTVRLAVYSRPPLLCPIWYSKYGFWLPPGIDPPKADDSSFLSIAHNM